MRILLLFLLVLAGTPAAASEAMDDHAYVGAVHALPNHGRTFVYFGHDDRWGPRVFSRDDGYFQGRGGGVAVQRGRAVYDYDRDYPYDFPRGWGADAALEYAEDEARAEPVCTIERVPDRRSGSVDVRVCR
jgi:hypothetical protein